MPLAACLSPEEASMVVPKRERLQEFYRRLMEAPRAATFDEALSQLTAILNAVEDELAGVPSEPGNWRYDGRIYPPEPDNMRTVPAHPGVARFRSVAHNTYIGANGAIEIVSVDGATEFRKPGADGRSLWDHDPR
jgi:hypothetical protein